MKNLKKVTLFGTALALCLALAACSGGSEPSAAPSDPTAPEASAPADSTAPEASAPADSTEPAAPAELVTVEAGKLHMSTNAAFPPYEMTTDDGSFEGIDVEIAGAIAEKLGLELVIDDMEFASALTAAQEGMSDIVMAGVTVTDDRLAVMDFSNSYSTGIQVIIVKEGSEVTLDTLGDYMIGTQRGTTGNMYCSDDYGEDHVMSYDNGITAIQALQNDQVDCVVIDNGPAREFVAANEGLVILDTEYAVEDYAIGMAKGNTALLDAVNGALAELQADGTVQAIVDKYISAE